MTRTRPHLLLLPLALSLLAGGAAAQGGPDPGVDREAMWPAPTAADWERPVRITFQRSWEDAVAVSRETGKPILICVNMDGEIASEHYAGIRYRQPEIAALYEPYVCVIASVYLHTPRDFDEQGRRVLCPRFGSVTCAEHVAIEPVLYEKYFEGRRVAPRHIMVELDGAEVYDVYYAWDTDSVFAAIRTGIEEREAAPPVVVRGDRPVVERVASRDVEDRRAVEQAYLEGDAELRRALLEAAAQHADAAPLDLLRMAVFGFDPAMNRLARQALAKVDAAGTEDLIAEALRVPMKEDERESLIAALERLGETSARARTLSVVHRGLATRSSEVDVQGWSSALEGGASYAPAVDWTALESRVDRQIEITGTRPADPQARLELAEASLALAVDPKTAQILGADPRTARKYSQLMFEDAYRTALQAEELGAGGWRVDAAIGLAAFYLGRTEEAHARAAKAVPEIPAGAGEWSAIATLALFAQARQEAITAAQRRKEQWPPQWLTDVNAAYSVIARHPLGTDAHVVAHFDFLRSLGAAGRAAEVLREGLTRFPESWDLHERMRRVLLLEKGVEGLEAAYEGMLAREGAARNLEWYAGYASLVAAESLRRTRERDQAVAAYDRAIAHYDRSIAANPETRETADHYAALALAGKARLAMERREIEQAVDELIASFERRPEAAGSLDGLNLSPADTARMLRAWLVRREREDLVARLDEAMAGLDPELLGLPAYERGVPGRGPGGRSGGGRRRPAGG